MFVIKRDGRTESMKYDKITKRIEIQCRAEGNRPALHPDVDPCRVAHATIGALNSGISTSNIDVISAKLADQYKLDHPDYGTLASRIIISNLHKSTNPSFAQTMKLHEDKIKPVYLSFIEQYGDRLDAMIDHERDYMFEYFGFKVLEASYLLKQSRAMSSSASIAGIQDERFMIMDRPQYMYMRVAITATLVLRTSDNGQEVIDVQDEDAMLRSIAEKYDTMSKHLYTHATPTLFNSLHKHQQCISCMLLGTEDSIEGIMKTVTDASLISKRAAGIGINMSNIRAAGSVIKGTNGISGGLPKQLRIYSAVADCWDQGGKRKGAIAVYLEPWHGDIVKFLEMKLPTGDEHDRARDLFYALWVPDLFWKRLLNDEMWSLFSEDTAPGLSDVYGDEFEELYTRYERENKYLRRMPARDLADLIFHSLRETGGPYIMNKDHVNRKTNHQNLGTIKGSNLCVHGDTKVMTDKGYVRIADIAGPAIDQGIPHMIWNGEKFSKSLVAKTGTDMPMARVVFSNNTHIDCTYDHEFYVANRLSYHNHERTRVNTKQLVVGDTIIPYSMPDGRVITDTKVVDILNLDGVFDSYCINEPTRHMVVFNGVLTGQCAEVTQFSTNDSYATCVLASINVRKHITANKHIDYDQLVKTARMAVRSLDNIIDVNAYPTPECEKNSRMYRSLGIGVQALAELFMELRLTYLSKDAALIDRNIFETIYYAALCESVELAKELGPYDGFHGSPMSKGILQFDMWERDLSKYTSSRYKIPDRGTNTLWEYVKPETSDEINARYSDHITRRFVTKEMWDTLRKDIMTHGVRNSLVVALMPTASTSQIFGNTESFEPLAGNMYVKTTLSGKYLIANNVMLRHLHELGIYDENMKQSIIVHEGRLKDIGTIPNDVKELYTSVWEMSQLAILERCAIRGAFVDQAASTNIHVSAPSIAVLRGIVTKGYQLGLKTCIYYLRNRPASESFKNNISSTRSISAPTSKESPVVYTAADEPGMCRRDDPDCEACGS